MAQATYYKLLSQDQQEIRVDSSLSSTSDQSTSSDDSLDLALVRIGNKKPKRKIKRKQHRRKIMGRNITNFDGADSYSVSNFPQVKKFLFIISKLK
jgi:hypothetical protein